VFRVLGRCKSHLLDSVIEHEHVHEYENEYEDVYEDVYEYGDELYLGSMRWWRRVSVQMSKATAADIIPVNRRAKISHVANQT
jgi:hypothetical protein